MNTRRIIWFCYAEKMWRNQLLLRCSFLSGKIINCLDTWSVTPFFFFFFTSQGKYWSYPISTIIFIWTLLGEGNGNPIRYSCLENPMDREAWKATVDGIAKSRIWLSGYDWVGYDWEDMTSLSRKHFEKIYKYCSEVNVERKT